MRWLHQFLNETPTDRDFLNPLQYGDTDRAPQRSDLLRPPVIREPYIGLDNLKARTDVADHDSSTFSETVLEIFHEVTIAAAIVVGHGLLVLLIIATIAVTNWALTAATHDPKHEAMVAGVSARYLIEGGEIILIGIVLLSGIVSAFATLTFGLWQRIRRSS